MAATSVRTAVLNAIRFTKEYWAQIGEPIPYAELSRRYCTIMAKHATSLDVQLDEEPARSSLFLLFTARHVGRWVFPLDVWNAFTAEERALQKYWCETHSIRGRKKSAPSPDRPRSRYRARELPVSMKGAREKLPPKSMDELDGD